MHNSYSANSCVSNAAATSAAWQQQRSLTQTPGWRCSTQTAVIQRRHLGNLASCHNGKSPSALLWSAAYSPGPCGAETAVTAAAAADSAAAAATRAKPCLAARKQEPRWDWQPGGHAQRLELRERVAQADELSDELKHESVGLVDRIRKQMPPEAYKLPSGSAAPGAAPSFMGRRRRRTASAGMSRTASAGMSRTASAGVSGSQSSNQFASESTESHTRLSSQDAAIQGEMPRGRPRLHQQTSLSEFSQSSFTSEPCAETAETPSPSRHVEYRMPAVRAEPSRSLCASRSAPAGLQALQTRSAVAAARATLRAPLALDICSCTCDPVAPELPVRGAGSLLRTALRWDGLGLI